MAMMTSNHISYNLRIQLTKSHANTNSFSSNLSVCNLKQNNSLQSLTTYARILPNYLKKHKRDFAVHSGMDSAGVPPPGPPNIFWIFGLAIAAVVPLISYKCGPTFKKKLLAALQVTEDVAETVEKVAEEVEKVAENISDHIPATGELGKAVDFVENFAERIAKDAGAVDDFIDKVQEVEGKAESLAESIENKIDDPAATKSNGQDAEDRNLEK
ncbi:uncharacterized protein LOC127246891 isoform X2 [Andrographis paniculata]|uniref:uncharacterized protein LOC127246891 isoform X2 n=1 Tax=Andrographis paniculata TaxID=175694 RepID=UPI0021E98E8C|nr:uncharacterized protein LOC127246891 isoform X2 [Andrographis paniculata]